MEIKNRLKDRLARIFRPPSLLRPTASSRSLSASAAGASSRSLSIAADIAHEPVFVPRRRASEADELHLSLLLRSFSLDRRTRKPLVSGNCGGCRPTSLATSAAKKKERVLRENGGFCENTGDGRTCPPASPSLPSPMSTRDFFHCFKEEEMTATKMMNSNMKKKKRCPSNRYELSISASSFNDEAFGFFSSEETETFFSSRSFSSDSSEFYRCPLPKKNMSGKKKKKKEEEKPKSSFRPTRTRRRAAKVMSRDQWVDYCKKKKCHLRQSEMENIPLEADKNLPKQKKKTEMNDFQPLVSVSLLEEEENAESGREAGFAVVKRSSDPYGDFRSSMTEMIVERQIFGAKELERLLHCYLTLNSAENHSAILRAFADISEVLFSY